jgi:hypothetical protein
MKKKNKAKPYWEMNTVELANATREFDRELVINECARLSAEMRARWEKARRKSAKSDNGRGIQVISIRVERKLLSRSEALAKKMGITRDGLIARGLKAVLTAAGEG